MPGPRRRARPSSQSNPSARRGKVAWIYQGGGARGAFQVGVTKALVEAGVYPDLILGSSVGVINACLYATGGVGHMEEQWRGYKSRRVIPRITLRDNLLFGRSLFSPAPMFRTVEAGIDFDVLLESDMEVGFVLLNLSHGQAEIRTNRTVESREELRLVTRAGYMIPVLHPPIQIGEDHFADGGFAWNVPLEYAINWGATEIYCIQCISRTLPTAHTFRSAVHVISRFYDAMWRTVGNHTLLYTDLEELEAQGIAVTVLEPKDHLGGYGMLNMLDVYPAKTERLIARGYADARASLRRKGRRRAERGEKVVPLRAPQRGGRD